jgi:hypothetical protein
MQKFSVDENRVAALARTARAVRGHKINTELRRGHANSDHHRIVNAMDALKLDRSFNPERDARLRGLERKRVAAEAALQAMSQEISEAGRLEEIFSNLSGSAEVLLNGEQ